MSVPTGKRNTSELQFLITAIDLRHDITDLLLRDFGLKDKVRTVETFGRMKHMLEEDEADFVRIVRQYHMGDDDAERLLELVDKYQMQDEDREKMLHIIKAYNLNDIVIEEYPKWIVDRERESILSILDELQKNLRMANSIYPVYEPEWHVRRIYQDKAIGNCFQLIAELQTVITIFPVNKQKYIRYSDMIDKEIALIRGWRKSDNKILTRIRKKEKHPKSQVVELLSGILNVVKDVKDSVKEIKDQKDKKGAA